MERLLEQIFLRVYFIMKLAMIYVVLLLAGGIVFGITPASSTIMALYDQHQLDVSQYHFFDAWSYYKRHFKESNLIFLVLGTVFIFLVYGLFLIVQLPNQTIFFILLSIVNCILAFYILVMYMIYLKLQVYFSFKTMIAIKLAAIATFFDFFALVKLAVGSVVCSLFLSRLPLVLAVFVPIIFLIFTFDVLDPIYKKVAEHYQPTKETS